MSVSLINATRFLMCGIAASLVVLLPVQADAQVCFEYVYGFLYTPHNCEARPDIDRTFRLQEITWNGHQYLFVDEGNEIKVMNIDNPQSPSSVTTSHFGVPNVGDSDYDLLNFSVCDDCRYGIASFKAATVLFDLGTGSVPQFVANYKNNAATLVNGGFTFKIGTQQYLVASTLGLSPCSNNVSGLYQFNGYHEDSLNRIQCLEGSPYAPKIVNGLQVQGTSPPVFYMAEGYDRFHIYQFNSGTTQLDYSGNGGIEYANMARGYGIGVDEGAGLAVVARFGDLKIYDIGWSGGSPTNPILLATEDMSIQTSGNAVALRYPVVHVGTQYSPIEPQTFDITDPTSPIPLDQEFWDPVNPWNSLGNCVWNQHAVFSRSGQSLYLARYSALQVVDPSACGLPLAHSTISPQPAFPGDQVTVTNTSWGGDEYATWITDGASPHGSNLLYGSQTFSTLNNPLSEILPVDMLAADQFWAHAAVQGPGHAYDPGGSTPDQIKTVEIIVNRTPGATIQITPQAAVTGDTVAVRAIEVGGHPSRPGGGDPFEWTVSGPSGEPTNYTGNPLNGHQVTLAESGTWTFDLDLFYAHENSMQPGQDYTNSLAVVRSISSVSAAFTISPTNLVHDQSITLTSTSRAQIGTDLNVDWDVLTTGGTLVNELSFCDDASGGSVTDQCTMVGETLIPGTYMFRLTLKNNGNTDEDVYEINNVEVADGSIDVDFTISDTTPDIGQFIGFSVTGIASNDIAQAVWSFGGMGCDGTTSYTCTAGGPIGCDVAAFAYDSSGSKTIALTVTSASAGALPPVQNSVTVSSAGSCDNPTCTYSLSPTSRTFLAEGGSGDVYVSTQAGCNWSASESASWVNITSGTSGSGPGTVTYTVAANTGDARLANIYVAGKVHTVMQAEGIPCGTGDVHDDGTVENAYGWGTGSAFVQEFTPPAYPFVYTDVCAGFTQAGGDSVLVYDVVVFDDDGPVGTPGTLLAEVPASIEGVPPWLDHAFGSVALASDGVVVDDGSVFIGTRWDDGEEIGFYVAADETPGTPGRAGFFGNDGIAWSAISGTFPQYRSLLMRADGFSPVDGDWEQMVGSIFGGGNGFGDAANAGVSAMAAFEGELFVGTDNTFGGEVNYSEDGSAWYLTATPGFGSPSNDAVVGLFPFEGFLYATTLNPVLGTEVWRLDNPAGGWLPAESGGFGDVQNRSAPSGSEFGGYLYLGTAHQSGCEIWRSMDGTGWGQVHSNGFGDSLNETAESMTVFRDELRVGTRNTAGAELWRTPDGNVWFSTVTGGFGSSANQAITDLVVFDGMLYAGVSNSVTGAQVWRSTDGFSWSQVVPDGFGDSSNTEFGAFAIGDLGLMATVSGALSRGMVWQSSDGVTWTPISSAGFANPNNEGTGALQYWDDRVYAGTFNGAEGCEVWRSGRHPLFEDGFESGDTGAW